MSAKPIGLRGQPSARASGSHIAITSGVRTIDGLSSGTQGWSASKFSSRPHSDEAGDHAHRLELPLGDLRLGVAGATTIWPSMNTGLPPERGALRVELLDQRLDQASASPASTTNETRMASAGGFVADATAAPAALPLSPPPLEMARTAATPMAATAITITAKRPPRMLPTVSGGTRRSVRVED